MTSRISRLIAISLTVSGFAQATAQTGPGGVGTSSTNMLWMRGDKGVSVSGTAVTGWSDLSGNGQLASPFAPANRPTQVNNALNGYPVLAFDGTDDELRIPDVSALDLTQWDIFLVCSAASPKSNNAWLSKGIGTQPNYAMWSNANNAVNLPIYDIFGTLSSPTTPNNTTSSAYSLVEYSNTVLLSLFPSRTVYKNGTSVYSDANLLRLPATNNNALYIGNVQGTSGWNLNGGLAEVILYKSSLNAVQRMVVNNYLAAKYGLTLSSGDVYKQDNAANGDYDHDVAGIGRVSSSAIQSDSRGTGVVQVNNPTNLGDNEFFFWGHDNGTLGSWGSTDYPATLQGRWHRVWRVNEVNAAGGAVDVGAVDITFDLTGQGAVAASDLRLLVDANNNGLFSDETPISGATSVGSNRYRFAGVTAIANNMRFSLGTIDRNDTPLPVELLFFGATPKGSDVHLEWATASERDNHHFAVERSTDAQAWKEVGQVAGAGTVQHRNDYALMDLGVPSGTYYYRLKQVDLDGTTSWSDVVAVQLAGMREVFLFPNPATDQFTVLMPEGVSAFDVLDAQGRAAHPVLVQYSAGSARVDASALTPGVYTVRFSDGTAPQRVVIAR